MQHILILTQLPFRRRDYERFGIEILSRHFQVKVLDCSAWLAPSYWQKYRDARFEFPGYVSVESREQFKGQIVDMAGQSVAIDFLFKDGVPRQIRNDLRKLSIRRVMVFSSVLPAIGAPGFAHLKTILRPARDAVRTVLSQVRRRVAPNFRPGAQPDIALLTGDASRKNIVAQGARQVWVHAFDYDIYLAHNVTREIPAAPYAVFLDQDMVFHPDLSFTGTPAASTKDSYYPALNQFFNRFERLTGCRVVIAAHPRSRYDVRPQLFGERQVIVGKTAELTRDATVVFAHYSESISFAVLWRKPLIFLTTVDIQKIWIQPYIHRLSKLLHSPIVNIDSAQDEDIDWPKWLDIRDHYYAQYQNNYIKRQNTPERPMWEIFSEYLLKQPS